MNREIINEIINCIKDVSLEKEEGKYLSDKAYGYDTIFFIAKFIERNRIGNRFDKKEQRQRAIEYIEDIFNLTPGTAGAVNYFIESLNLLEFANIIKKINNDQYIIINNRVLNFICEYPENAYIFIYLLTYMTMKNDGILELFNELYNNEQSKIEKDNYIQKIYKEFNNKSVSIQSEESNWSKQLVKYTNIILGFVNRGVYFSRTLNINENKDITIYDISLNVEGTRTPGDLRKKNDYIFKFSKEYVTYMLEGYTFDNVTKNAKVELPQETIASELAELKLDIIDSNVAPDINNDFEKKQFVEDKMKTRNQAVQREFRRRLFDNNKNVCPVCGFSFKKFLIASHIKPYALCDNTYDAINQFNGLLLCPNHDRLFESAKYMTIDSRTGTIVLNNEAKKSKDYGMLDGKRIDIRLVNCERTHYLRWHNQRFISNNAGQFEENMVAEDSEKYDYK